MHVPKINILLSFQFVKFSFEFFRLSGTCWKVKTHRLRSVMHEPQLTEKQQIEWKFQLPCGLEIEAARTKFGVKKVFFSENLD